MKQLLILIGLLAMHGVAAAGEDQATSEAWQMIEQGALVIDVRSASEYADGHLDEAINVPHTETTTLADAIGADLDRPVVLYCRSGRRAGIAQSALEELGYTRVHNGIGYEPLADSRPE